MDDFTLLFGNLVSWEDCAHDWFTPDHVERGETCRKCGAIRNWPFQWSFPADDVQNAIRVAKQATGEE